LRAIVLTAPAQLREQLRHHNKAQLIRTCQHLRPDTNNTADPAQAVKVALRSLAHRIDNLDQEATALHTQIQALTEAAAPTTSALFALGPDTVSALLVSIGDNPPTDSAPKPPSPASAASHQSPHPPAKPPATGCTEPARRWLTGHGWQIEPELTCPHYTLAQ